MNQRQLLRATLLGLSSWAIPLAVSFAFYDRSGKLLVDEALFKSVMVVISGGAGSLLLILAFRRITPTWRSGLLLGTGWLALNWLLDLAVLVPMTHMHTREYWAGIGIRYLLLPIMSFSAAAIAEARSSPGERTREQ